MALVDRVKHAAGQGEGQLVSHLITLPVSSGSDPESLCNVMCPQLGSRKPGDTRGGSN